MMKFYAVNNPLLISRAGSLNLGSATYEFFHFKPQTVVKKRCSDQEDPQLTPLESSPSFVPIHHGDRGFYSKRAFRISARSSRMVEPPVGPLKLLAHSGNYSWRGRRRRFEPSIARQQVRKLDRLMARANAISEFYEDADEKIFEIHATFRS